MTGAPPRLVALQHVLVDAIRRPQPLGDDEAMTKEALRIATGNTRMRPVDQVDVYREQFFLRHVPSLEEDFPAVVHVLGSDSFHDLAVAYLAAFPPRTFDLRQLGAHLPDFVATRAPWSEDALIADAARIDWAFMQAFDAADAPPFDPRVVADAPEDAWPGARLELHPSVRRLALAFPAHELRASALRKEPLARPEARASSVVVWRGGAVLHAVEIESVAFELLDALASGQPLGAACEAVARARGITDANELAPSVGAWFQQWTARGWVAALHM
jgi:hypothetical protein